MIDPDLTSAPSVVRELTSTLIASGFDVAVEHGSGFVNHVLEFVGPGCQVRISVDRGQWWIELARPPEIEWYDPDVWAACLDERPISREPSSLEEQSVFVEERWGEIAAAGQDVADRLARKRATRARERLGLPPEIGEEPA